MCWVSTHVHVMARFSAASLQNVHTALRRTTRVVETCPHCAALPREVVDASFADMHKHCV